jgi:hypothetical protein
MPEIIQVPDMTPKRTARFMRYVYRGGDDDDCWTWIGTIANKKHNPRPTFRLDYSQWSARQVAYSMAVGDIPIGHHVAATCNNPICVNPRHLTIVPNTPLYRR